MSALWRLASSANRLLQKVFCNSRGKSQGTGWLSCERHLGAEESQEELMEPSRQTESRGHRARGAWRQGSLEGAQGVWRAEPTRVEKDGCPWVGQEELGWCGGGLRNESE